MSFDQDATGVIADQKVSTETGLSDDEVADRLATYGPNELRSAPPEPIWKKFLRQFQDPLVYLLLAAVVISLLAWQLEGAHGLPIDAIVIAIIVVANALIGFVQEQQAEDAVAALSKMAAPMSTVLRDGVNVDIATTGLVPGDILVLSEGDAVGADARLISAAGLKIQESSLTGESESVVKDPDTVPADTPLAERTDMVYKGTEVVEGVGTAVVVATGMNTELGAIAQMIDEADTQPTPLEREIERVSRALGILVVAIAVVVMVVLAVVNGVRTFEDAVEVLLLGVSLAVAAVPEGLPATLSLVLALGVRAMARRNALVKRLHDVETLGSASVICSDKTGTLTRNAMTLRTIVTPSGETELSGTGYAPVGEVVGDVPPEVVEEARRLLIAGTLANNASLRESDGDWTIQGDPTEAAFLVAGGKVPGTTETANRFERRAEVPFTSRRKMMSVLGSDGETGYIFSKGAPDVLLDRCAERVVGDQQEPLTDDDRDQIAHEVDRLSARGYRTLGVAARQVDPDPSPALNDDDETDLAWVGVVGIIDPPRDEAIDAIAEAHRAGIRTVMITGDHPVTARRIAVDLGMIGEHERVATGNDLDAASDDEFAQIVRDVSVYARVAPEHKLAIVDVLQGQGEVVAMTGDGVNDAPALKAADIGVAMGITGTEVSKNAASMILADDNYATIVAAVRQGRGIYDNIAKFLRYMLGSNMGEVVAVFFGIVLAGVLGLVDPANPEALVVPLLATQILWVNLVTDSIPALAMGVDPETEDLMARSPRAIDARIIDGHMWQRVLFVGTVMGAVTLLTMDTFLPGGLFEGGDSFEVARTAGFTTLVFAQLFNAFNSRADTASAFRNMFSNHWLVAAVVLVALLQIAVVEVPFMQSAFGTEHLDATHWGVAIAMASIVLWGEELVKFFRRRAHR